MYICPFHLENLKINNMTTEIKKRKDDEKYFVVGLVLFFGAIITSVDIWYSDWPGMAHTFLAMALIFCVILHILTVIVAAAAIANWADPNMDDLRKWFSGIAFAVILFVGGFRAAFNEKKAVADDSSKAKQEQKK